MRQLILLGKDDLDCLFGRSQRSSGKGNSCPIMQAEPGWCYSERKYLQIQVLLGTFRSSHAICNEN